jgi:hypothetical protein
MKERAPQKTSQKTEGSPTPDSPAERRKAKDDPEFEPSMVEITAFIRADQRFALDLIENSERRRLGGDFDSASLIQEALDLLIEKKLVVVRLGRKNLG